MTDKRAGACKNDGKTHASTGRWVSIDPSLHEQAVKPWELLTSCLSRGPFRHEMRYLSAPAFSVYEERFSCPVRLRGQSPPGVIALAVPIRVPPSTLCWKVPWSIERMPAITGDVLDARLGAGHEQLIVLIEHSLVERVLGAERTQRLEALCRSRGVPCTEIAVARLRAFLAGLIDLANTSPEPLRDPTAVQSIENDIVRHIAAAVAVPLEQRSAGRSHRERSGRRRLLARTLEVVRSANSADLSIPQLCAAAGVNQRSLEYAFRETFDATPLEFLRLKRLHSARLRLLAADPAHMAVTDIAYQEGFYHLGRFAAAFEATFGERPSQTLRRPCPEELSHLPAVRPLLPGELSRSRIF